MPLLTYDPALVADLASRFDLREPNREALTKLVKELATQDEPSQLTLDLATGVGKTYILAAMLEYAAAQGVKNLLVVVPGKTVRAKTIGNFTPGAPGFIEGAEIPKVVITPQNFRDHGQDLADPNAVKLFLMNIQNLTGTDTDEYVEPGKAKAAELRTARPQEALGGSLLEYLADADDLLMVLDESHLYSASAKAWSPALDRLKPSARVGLTATPVKGDDVIYSYTLRQAIEDRLVKMPVLALRAKGYPDNAELGQLKDAKELLDYKAGKYRAYESMHPDARPINPIMLVACAHTAHADEVAATLRSPAVFGSEEAVLAIHSKAMTDEIEGQLARVQEAGSPVRAIVQVDMLTEGWNVHNVAVLVPLRALASKTLTAQLIGRGLRLPYGRATGDSWIDSLDVLSHASVRDVLKTRGIETGRYVEEAPEPATTSTTEPGQPSTRPGGHESASVVEGAVPGGEGIGPVDLIDGGETISLDPSAAGHDELAGATAELGGEARIIDPVVDNSDPAPERLQVELTDPSAYFDFPKATFEQQSAQLLLAELDDDWIRRVAAGFGAPFGATLTRQKMIVQDDRGHLKLVDADDAVVSDFPLEQDAIAGLLVANLRNEPLLKNGPSGRANYYQAEPFARRLLACATGEWTAKRGTAAVQQLIREIRAAAKTASTTIGAVPKITPLRLPKRSVLVLAPGEKIPDRHDVPDQVLFRRGEFYSGWTRGMFTAAAFDAYETEFAIARLLDRADTIASWTRLYLDDGASIEYAPGRNYYPDFVAIDVDGTHWIIEGKAESGRADDEVQAKRAAAEKVLRHMEGDPRWRETRWGYVIGYQDDVRRAETWRDLLAVSKPRRMA